MQVVFPVRLTSFKVKLGTAGKMRNTTTVQAHLYRDTPAEARAALC